MLSGVDRSHEISNVCATVSGPRCVSCAVEVENTDQSCQPTNIAEHAHIFLDQTDELAVLRDVGAAVVLDVALQVTINAACE